MNKILIILFVFSNYQVKSQYSTFTSERTQNATLNGKNVFITIKSGTTNGEKFQKCYVDDVKIDCQLISECWNENKQIKCEKIEQILQESPKTKQKKEDEEEIKENIYIKTYISKKNIFKGEQIEIAYKLFYRINLSGFESRNMPNFNGFWKEEVKIKEEIKEEIINNKRYITQDLYKVLLTPQKSGKITVDPLEYVFLYRSNNPRDFFKEIPINVKSKKISIKVKPLPETEIKEFKGIVGVFDINSEINTLNIESNNPINYSITIKGLGNFELIENPDINFPSDFDVYEPKVNLKSFKTKQGTRGEKKFEFIILPRYPGNYQIPSYSFTFFNPKEEKYITKETESFSLKVNKGQNDERTIKIYDKKETEAIKDIKYIYDEFKLKKNNISSYNIILILILTILPIILIITYLIIKKLKIDLIKEDQSHENKALKNIKKLEKEINKNKINNSDFYDIMDNILWNYLSNKYEIPISEISKEKIQKKLKETDIKKENQNKINELIKMFELFRFSQMKEEKGKIEDLLKTLKNVINSVK